MAVRLILGFLIAWAVASCAADRPSFRGTDISGVPWGKDFTLVSHVGQPISTEEFRGKVLILFFGYTHCPDICAPTLAKLAALRRQLGAESEAVQVLFMTVDPAHDTPDQLRRFVGAFDSTFIGLTGSPEQIDTVAREHKVSYSQGGHASGESPTIDHSGAVLVKDRRGRPRLLFRNEASVADMEHDIRLLLKQGVGH